MEKSGVELFKNWIFRKSFFEGERKKHMGLKNGPGKVGMQNWIIYVGLGCNCDCPVGASGACYCHP